MRAKSNKETAQLGASEEVRRNQESQKVRELETNLGRMLNENEQLNDLLLERVEEVKYLQTTIRDMQEALTEKYKTDSYSQRIIKDLETEIKRYKPLAIYEHLMNPPPPPQDGHANGGVGCGA